MVKKYERKTGISYDWIVRYRPYTFVEHFPDQKEFTPMIHYGSKKYCCCGNEDTFAFGPRMLMDEYFERYNVLQITDNILPEKSSWTAENYVERTLQKNNISLFMNPDLKVCVVKPKHRKKPSDP